MSEPYYLHNKELSELEQQLTQKDAEIAELKHLNDSLLECLRILLPILEERLSCGAYMRQKLNYNKRKLNNGGINNE